MDGSGHTNTWDMATMGINMIDPMAPQLLSFPKLLLFVIVVLSNRNVSCQISFVPFSFPKTSWNFFQVPPPPMPMPPPPSKQGLTTGVISLPTNSSPLKIDLWNLGDSYWKAASFLEIMLSFGECTLQETNISTKHGILKMIFLFPRWDMLVPWRVTIIIP